ncbi:MAG TPA: creatininase family protein, partial [Longimicrobiales bacterium]|nr:creatininase family protein [Longimicrobiales bacterium]
MRIADLSWMELAAHLEDDDRGVLPLGSIEQHAYLSLATDAILAERVALEAAEPLGVPVQPAIPYGLAAYFTAYPGTITLRPGTYAALVTDVLDGMADSGFRRILLVNGHGGNGPIRPVAARWARERGGVQVAVHDWWRAPRTLAAVEAAGEHGSHANWMESFPWTRPSGSRAPEAPKAPLALTDALRSDPRAVRELLGDGSFGGAYQAPDEVMLRI